jgi:hypothetical protein
VSTDISTNEEVSLWECLHDGPLESVTSDMLARSMTILVDVPYVWKFHQMPSETRFRLVLEGVRVIEAFQFAAWPGELVKPEGVSWEESERLRHEHYKKGRLESIDWQILAQKLEHPEEYEISNATITESNTGTVILMLQLTDYSRDFPEIRVTAEKLRTFLNADHELTLEEFLALGEAYWKAFSERRI